MARDPWRLAVGLCALLVLAGVPRPAAAIDPALCSLDGVSEVPPFAPLGRDGNQCLLLDPGNGDPVVPFQFEAFHLVGVSDTATHNPVNPGVEALDLRGDEADICDTKTLGEYCSVLLWDVTVDNYLDPAVANDDLWFVGKGKALQYILIKDTKFINGYKCGDGGGWKGPNGTSCAPGEDSSSHSDGIQIRGNPVGGGWLVFQDSVLANAPNALLRIQAAPDYPPPGNIAFQGAHVGQTNGPLGEAKSWIDDCLARGGATHICAENSAVIGFAAPEIWLIDVWGSSSFSGFVATDKLIIVNTGCTRTGCNGRVGYNNGWPQPLDGGKNDVGPGTCPNGLMAAPWPWDVAALYCYTSLENAAIDHKLPPFAGMSQAGWANPPPSP